MRNVNILWAEDNDIQYLTCSKSLNNYFRKRNYFVNIKRAFDGNEVYRYLSDTKNRFDVLLTDIDMPKWNGIETVIDLSIKYPGLPLVIISSKTQLPKFNKTLKKLINNRIIRGYFEVEPRENWLEETYKIIDKQLPTILHLSDIHFGAFHAFKQFTKINIQEIFNSAINIIRKNHKIDLLVSSGDLTSKGEQDEFKSAKKFMEFLIREFNLSHDRIIVVPGNHDIFRKEEPGRRFDKFIEFLNNLYKSSSYSDLIFNRYPEIYDNKKKELSINSKDQEDDLLYCICPIDELKIIIIGLNSVVSQEDNWEISQINARQLYRIDEKIEKLKFPRKDYLRLAVMHHHLMAVPSVLDDCQKNRTVNNASLILHHFISQRINLILHGHTHYSIAYKYLPYYLNESKIKSSPIHVLATGTLSGEKKQISQSYFSFNIIKLSFGSKAGSIIGTIWPYRLKDDMLKWNEEEPTEIDMFE
jgi:3',5'-cyclic AMP phosphodiesterase CpdA/CheY-like chemotaxis protein